MRFSGRQWRVFLLVFGGLVLLGGAVPALAAATAITARVVAGVPQSHPISATLWSAPKPLPAGNDAGAIGCGGTGDCTATGSANDPYSTYPDSAGYVDNESKGKWQAPRTLAGINTLDQGNPVSLNQVYCISPGNCVVTGTYDVPASPDWDLYQALVATETNGVWGPAQAVPGLGALNTGDLAAITSVSCSTPGYCTAAGYYTAGFEHAGPTEGAPFSVNEVAGKWQQAQAVPGLVIRGVATAATASVSCASAGNCMIAGGSTILDSADITDSTDAQPASKAFAIQETRYKLGPKKIISGMAGINAVVCRSAGTCTAVGGNQVATATKGSWSKPKAVGDKSLSLTALACPATGSCLAGGSDAVSAPQNTAYAYTVQEANGAWHNGAVLPGLNTGDQTTQVTSLTCVSAGNCEIGSTNYSNGYINNQVAGVISGPQAFAGGLSTISCASSGGCAALAAQVPPQANSGKPVAYADYTQKQPIATSTALGLAAAKITYGHEIAEKISVSVRPEADDPKGKVVVKAGKTTVCVIALGSAKGSCKLTAKQLKPGTYAITATYAGAPGFRSSVSVAKKLIVVN